MGVLTVVAFAGSNCTACAAAAAFTVRRCIRPRPKAATPRTKKRLSWRRYKFFSRDIDSFDATDAEFCLLVTPDHERQENCGRGFFGFRTTLPELPAHDIWVAS